VFHPPKGPGGDLGIELLFGVVELDMELLPVFMEYLAAGVPPLDMELLPVFMEYLAAGVPPLDMEFPPVLIEFPAVVDPPEVGGCCATALKTDTFRDNKRTQIVINDIFVVLGNSAIIVSCLAFSLDLNQVLVMQPGILRSCLYHGI
jgi:hypothetical protein